MAKTYGQLADEIKDWKDFESKLAKELSMHPLLEWKNKKTQKLAKKLYNKGYNIADSVGFIILNS